MVKENSASARVGRSVINIYLFAMLAIFITPFLLVIINSLKSKRTIVKDPLALIEPGGVIFDNYINAFEKMNYPMAFANSLFITVLSVALILVLSSMTAYLFVRADWKINKIVFSVMIASMVVPFQSLMIPLVSLYGSKLGWLNYRTTLVFMYIGFGVGMATFIYHGFIRTNMPVALEEAARIDGCGQLQTFFLIVFPLLKPTTATLIVLDVLWIWNDYLLPSLVLGKSNLYTLPLSSFEFFNTYTVDYGGIMASLMLTILPVLILFLFLQKQVIGGVVSGAVKG